MNEVRTYVFIVYLTTFIFSILVSISDRKKIINFIQGILVSSIFITILLSIMSDTSETIYKLLFNILSMLMFLLSVIPNIRIVEYISNKKKIFKSKINDAINKTIISFSTIITLIAIYQFINPTEYKTILMLTTANIVFSLILLSVMMFYREITLPKLLEELVTLFPLLTTQVLLIQGNAISLEFASLPLVAIIPFYTYTSSLSPFSINQENKNQIFSSFVLVMTLIAPVISLLINSLLYLSNHTILILTLSFVLVISILSSPLILSSIKRHSEKLSSLVIKNLFKNITEEEIVSMTIGDIINRIHLSIRKFLGKNIIELYSFNNINKTLDLLLIVDGDSGITKNKSIEISEEELNKIIYKLHKFFIPTEDIPDVFKKLESDVIIPISYEYDLKFIISIKIQDRIEYNNSVISFLSGIFHLLILETQSIITTNLAQKIQHNAIVFIRDSNIRQEITTLLIMENFNTFGVKSYGDAIKLIDKMNIDLLICDNEIDDKSGINLIKQIKSDPFKNTIFTVMGFYEADEANTKEFLESLADLQIILKDNFFLLSNTISYITYNLLTKKKVENTFKSITTINYNSATLLSKVIGSKTISFDEIESDIISKIFSNTEINLPNFILIGKINNSFIESKVFTILSEKHITNLGTANIPIDFFSRKKFSKNKTIFSDFLTEGISPVEFSKLFAKEITNIVNTVYNFLAISSEDTVIIGINFSSKISLLDIDFMKSVLINYLMMKIIYEEVREIDSAFIYTMQSLARAAEEMDEETGAHIYRVGEYSKLLSKYLGFNEEFCNSIYYASQTHDIGKLRIPREILRKPGILTPEEYEIMKEHTIAGAIILGDHEKLRMAREIALSHHEKWDGSGYPYGLEKDKIPLSARITSISDIYDALRSPRTYKPEFDQEKTVKIITEGNGRTKPSHFDPDILQAFKELSDKFNEIYEKYREE
ncbi:MAG: HD domain-containing phosphohydrolase [Brevinematia bacterium]